MTTIYTSGCYNLIGPHHIDFLRKARKLGDELIVFLDSDKRNKELKPGKVFYSWNDRRKMLLELTSVSSVSKLNSFADVDELLSFNANKEAIFVKGRDYDISTMDSELMKVLDRWNVPIAFIPLIPGYSTTSLVEKIAEEYFDMKGDKL